jgi:cell division ATPase FtsA
VIDAGQREWALRKAREKATAADSEVIDALPVRWTVRGNAGAEREVEDPVGETGRQLTCHALVITARRGYRAELAALARTFGWELDGVIAQPVALYRGMASSLFKAGTTIVLDCGGRHTTVLVRVKQQLLHLATHEFGGDDLTRRIGEALDLGQEDAEKLKRQVDIGSIGNAPQLAGQQVIWADLQAQDLHRQRAARIAHEAVTTFFSDLARELRESGHLGQKGHVHLVGRAAGLAGMPKVVHEIFELPVILGTGDKQRNPGDEMDNLLNLGQIRVAAQARRDHLLTQGASLVHRAGGLWAWLVQRFE